MAQGVIGAPGAAGAGAPKRFQRFDPTTCPRCMACPAINDDSFWGACASVGIEHGKSAARMALEYLAAYHARGHREP